MRNSLKRALCIDDLRKIAKRRLPRSIFEYMDGGADDEVTLRYNSESFSHYEFLPRTLVDVENIDLSTEVMGTQVDLPVLFSPTGMSRLFYYQGEAAVARAAKRAGTIYSLSSMGSYSIEEVAEFSDGPKWFQIYVWRDRNLLRDFIQRCKAANYKALCLTVDLATAGNRERDIRNGFTIPPKITPGSVLDVMQRPAWLWHFLTSSRMSLANVKEYFDSGTDFYSLLDLVRSQFDASVTWEDAEWMIKEWGGPFAIKGIITADDAKRAVDIGASAVIISNHGGRQLDHAPATIDALPEIVEAVEGRLEVILDGGIRRGTDVLKALALGARACMIGRAYLYGLSAGGEAGVDHAMMLLSAEIERGMKLLGCRSIKELDSSFIRSRNRY